MPGKYRLLLLNFPLGYDTDLSGEFEVVFAGKAAFKEELAHKALNFGGFYAGNILEIEERLEILEQVKTDVDHLQALGRQVHMKAAVSSFYSLQRLAHQQILYALYILSRYSVDMVCIAHVPHIGYDYALIKAASILSLPTFVCEHNTFFKDSYSLLSCQESGRLSRIDPVLAGCEPYIASSECLQALYRQFGQRFHNRLSDKKNGSASRLLSDITLLLGQDMREEIAKKYARNARFYLHYQPESSTSFSSLLNSLPRVNSADFIGCS